MNALLLALFGFVGGMIFGLLVGWGMVSLVVAMIGVIVMLAGSFLPTLFRPAFATAILGFLLSWIVSGGLSLL
jgi:hypothetical protein